MNMFFSWRGLSRIMTLGLLFVYSLVSTSTSQANVFSRFTILSQTPVILNGTTAWERGYPYTDPGALIYHDGAFHLFRNAYLHFRDFGSSISYMRSTDGITWKEVNKAPIIRTRDLPAAKVSLDARSVIVMDDGTWVLYLVAENNRSSTIQDGVIYRATASKPAGPWQVDPTPALEPGKEPKDWDRTGVYNPYVIRTKTAYFMYYNSSTFGERIKGRIGMAISQDGITWKKWERNPTMTPWRDRDESRFSRPLVFPAKDGTWLMLFTSLAVDYRSPFEAKVATSTDGFDWAIMPTCPTFRAAEVSPYLYWGYPAAALHDGKILYLISLESEQPSTRQIYAIEFTSDLLAP